MDTNTKVLDEGFSSVIQQGYIKASNSAISSMRRDVSFGRNMYILKM